MEWAGKESVCLIPFGGGTSVTRALEVPPLHIEPRPVVSVDMRKVPQSSSNCLPVTSAGLWVVHIVANLAVVDVASCGCCCC